MSVQPFPNVSRETLDRLEHFAELLRKWNQRINLVSRSSMEALWDRHITDSAQLYSIAPHPVGHWVDLGSGGGFPGLVIAIMAMESGSPVRLTLVESDTRKSAFLRTVIRDTGASAQVLNGRMEEIEPLGADVVSARALADLTTLLGYAKRHMIPEGVAIFPKGKTWKKELVEAQSKWNFSQRIDKSNTQDGPVVLSITGVSSV